MSSADQLDSSVGEERAQFLRKERRILKGKLTRTVNRLKDLIYQRTENRSRLEREIKDIRVDFNHIRLLHSELYEHTLIDDHPKLDDWEEELVEEIHNIEDQLDTYLRTSQSEINLETHNSKRKTAENGDVELEDNFSDALSEQQLSREENKNGNAKPVSEKDSFDSWITKLREFEETVSAPAETMTVAEALYKLEAAKDMPSLQLSKFDGNPLHYVDFMERFKIHIHQKSHLTDEMRLAQLRMHLCGEAERSVAGLGCDGTMYATVLKQLRDEYGQPSCIARAHIKRIVDGPKVSNRTELKELSLDMLTCIATLKRINNFADVNSSEVLRRIISRLPNYLIDRWKNEVATLREKGVTPSIIHISDIVRKRVKAEFDPDFGDIDKPSERTQGNSQFQVRRGINAQHIVPTCVICDKTGHRPFECQTFHDQSVAERVQTVQSHKLCYSCLNRGHISRDCRFKRVCGENGCLRTHNKLLHTVPPNTSSVTSVLDYSSMLPVVRCAFRAPNGRIREGNILIDGGAGTTVIRKQFARALGLQGKSENLDLCVVGGGTVQQRQSRRVEFYISPLSGGEEFTIDAFELEHTIGDIQSLDKPWLKTFQHLSDLDFSCKAGQIDLILGVQYSHLHTEEEIREGLAFEPVAKKSKLGWYVIGADNVQQLSPVGGVQVLRRADAQRRSDETVTENSTCGSSMENLETSCEEVRDQHVIDLSLKPSNLLTERLFHSSEKSLDSDEKKVESISLKQCTGNDNVQSELKKVKPVTSERPSSLSYVTAYLLMFVIMITCILKGVKENLGGMSRKDEIIASEEYLMGAHNPYPDWKRDFNKMCHVWAGRILCESECCDYRQPVCSTFMVDQMGPIYPSFSMTGVDPFQPLKFKYRSVIFTCVSRGKWQLARVVDVYYPGSDCVQQL